MRSLLLFFIITPIVEMYLLIQVGGIIGALPTVGLVVLTATLGIWLLRLEGLATLNQVQEKLNRGEIPGRELLEGIMLLIGGALLLTPGFVTDAIGFTCLLPMLRKPIAQWLINYGLFHHLHFSGAHFSAHSQFQNHGRSDVIDSEDQVVDAEYEDLTHLDKKDE